MAELYVKQDGGVGIKMAPLTKASVRNKKNQFYRYKKRLREQERLKKIEKQLMLGPLVISEETRQLFDPLPDSFFSNLAASIVYRACLDYEDALIKYYTAPEELKSEKESEANDLKRFFGSTWYYLLVDLDPREILIHIEDSAKYKFENGLTKRSKRRNFASLD